MSLKQIPIHDIYCGWFRIRSGSAHLLNVIGGCGVAKPNGYGGNSLNGHSNTRFSAMAKATFFYPPARRAWWRLEGVTKVDCALITNDTLVFVEGKRTELCASKDVLWYKGRNQVLRNLDCAREMAWRAKIPNYYMLMIVEGSLCGEGTARWSELQQVVAPETVVSSLPHLKAEEREAIMQRFLGYTTWERVADRFRLDFAALPGLNVKAAQRVASGRG